MMASFPGSTVANPASNRLYTAEEWEQTRRIITQLYRDEARPLQIVQLMLAQQHAFRPRYVPAPRLGASN
jgi:hypothetical protein